MQVAIAKGEYYFYILNLKEKNAFKVGVSSNDLKRVKHHEHNYGGINYKESLIIVSPNKKAIVAFEKQILSDYEEYNVSNDFSGIDGYTEMLSGDCLQRVLEDVQVKAERFPTKKFHIIRDIGLLVTEPEDVRKEAETKVSVTLSVSKARLHKLYGAEDTDVLLKVGERIPLFTFPTLYENSLWNIGPRYFIAEGCYIRPRAANTLRTREGRKLMALFIQYGRKPDVESYLLAYGAMADGLEMSRNIETLAWLQESACKLWCGASIESISGGCGGINYINGTTTPVRIKDILERYYSSDIYEMSKEIWDLEFDLGIGKSLFHALQKWFYVPDIPIELWDSVSTDGRDFFGEFIAKHIRWQSKQKK